MKLRIHNQRLRIFLKVFLISMGCLALLFIACIAAVLFFPTRTGIFFVNRFSPESHFHAESIKWNLPHQLVLENVQITDFLKAKRVTIQWSPRNLARRHLDEVKFEQAELSLDFAEVNKIGSKEAPVVQVTSADGLTWYLDKLVLERSSLVMVHLAPDLPPLSFELEGVYGDVPLGNRLSDADMKKERIVELRQIHIHPSSDQVMTLLKIDDVIFKFNLAGLRSHELESLTFNHPTLSIDEQFFWFVEVLRKMGESKSSSPYTGPEWKVHRFRVAKGELDITRLKEIISQYPLRFEVTRDDLELKKLSLADFAVDMDIPLQNVYWEKGQVYFKNLQGKISFHLGKKAEELQKGKSSTADPNNVVNTLRVDEIRWKDFVVENPWLSLTFSKNFISGSLGGAFADGYLNGDLYAGWSGTQPWSVSGSAANVDAGYISNAASNETFAMSGRAEFKFAVKGQGAELSGNANLVSLSKGTIQILSMDRAIEKVQKESQGMKRELLETMLTNLRDYPYEKYHLDLNYNKPNATLNFLSEGERGQRKLDLQWHGLDDRISSVPAAN